MKFELFIANRILKSKTATRKVSRPVIRISVWAIALGIIIMILTMATGTGLRKEIRNKVIGFSGHIQILNYQPNPTLEQEPVNLSDTLLRDLENTPGIAYIQPFAKKAGIIKTDNNFEGALIKGVGESFQWENFRKYLREGRIMKIRQGQYNDSILMSVALASKLELKTGDKIAMYFVREAPSPPLLRYFYISGLFRTDFEDIDNSFIIGDLHHIQRLNKWEDQEVGGYEIFLENEDHMAEMTADIRTRLPFEYDALSARQLNEQLFQWLDLFDINIAIILVIMVIVAVINISIALLILILERTQMTGILKTLGSSDISIRKIFLINAGQLIIRGLFWGNIIGIGLCLAQQQWGLIKLDPEVYYVSQVSINLDVWSIIFLNLGTLAVCMICLVLPSYIITRISPVKAIRFD